MANLGIQNNNPGNLKDPATGNFKVFATPAEGLQALTRDLVIKQSGQSPNIKPGASISDLANVWAPKSDNNKPENWASNVANYLGVPTAYAFDQIPPEKLAQGIQVAEGTTGINQNNNPQSNQLTRQQIIENINAMESQGATHDDIQGYLDSLNKQTNQPSDLSNSYVSRINKPSDENNQGTQEQGLGEKLQGRIQGAGTGLSQAGAGVANILTGKGIGRGLLKAGGGILHTAGELAGGAGDVITSALENTPVVGGIVKGIEGAIGSGVGSLAKTETGQSVIKEISKFSQNNPEIAQAMGDTFNIATFAVPILKGLRSIGNVALRTADGVGLKTLAEKEFANQVPQVISNSGKTGTAFSLENPDVGKKMVELGIAPDINIVGGKFITNEAVKSSENAVKSLNSEVKNILSSPDYNETPVRPSTILNNVLNGYVDRNGNAVRGLVGSGLSRKDLIQTVSNLDRLNRITWNKFASGKANISEVNKLRSSLDDIVQKIYTGETQSFTVDKQIGAKLAGSMRDFVQKTAPETQQLFKNMTDHYDIQDALKFMNKKKVPMGAFLKTGSTIASAGIGGLLGATLGAGTVPVGALAGLWGKGIAERGATGLTKSGISLSALKRTAPDAIKQTPKQIGKNTGGLLGGLMAQRQNQSNK